MCHPKLDSTLEIPALGQMGRFCCFLLHVLAHSGQSARYPVLGVQRHKGSDSHFHLILGPPYTIRAVWTALHSEEPSPQQLGSLRSQPNGRFASSRVKPIAPSAPNPLCPPSLSAHTIPLCLPHPTLSLPTQPLSAHPTTLYPPQPPLPTPPSLPNLPSLPYINHFVCSTRHTLTQSLPLLICKDM